MAASAAFSIFSCPMTVQPEAQHQRLPHHQADVDDPVRSNNRLSSAFILRIYPPRYIGTSGGVAFKVDVLFRAYAMTRSLACLCDNIEHVPTICHGIALA